MNAVALQGGMTTAPLPPPPPKHPLNSEEEDGGGDCYVNVSTSMSARKPPTSVAAAVPSSMVSSHKVRAKVRTAHGQEARAREISSAS